MTNLIKSWNDRVIRIRGDRYVNLTDMAQACGKRFPDWNRLDSSKSYLETLSSVVQIPTTELVQTKQGGTPDEQGTWGHPKIAIRFAQWCSDEFAVQVDCWIDELLTTGKVELQPTPPPQPPLPPADIRIVELHRALSGFGIDISNPRYNQAIQDLVVNRILGENTPQLPGDRWLGVVEKAEILGYSHGKIVQFRSSLGKFVAAQSDSLDVRSECRLVNGTQRKVKLYRDCAELGRLVSEFMDAKVLAS